MTRFTRKVIWNPKAKQSVLQDRPSHSGRGTAESLQPWQYMTGAPGVARVSSTRLMSAANRNLA